MFTNFNNKITILKTTSLFLPQKNQNITNNITTILHNQNINIILNTHIKQINHHENQIQIHNKHTQLTINTLLITSNHQPTTTSLHPKNTNITINKHKTTIINKQLHTTTNNI